jgi:bifunctional UDP-N-acetylglucosamine pyrophosphorylase/glucosamine-1-phosphate N-acetyltransferase
MSQSSQSCQALVLAAGKGTRMRSSTIKVLHPMLGRTLIDWVVSSALEAGIEAVTIVVGHDREHVQAHLSSGPYASSVTFAEQLEQLGTGHAVWSARDALLAAGSDYTLVLSGDVPNLSAETLTSFLGAARQANVPVAMITARLDEPARYGRIVRADSGEVTAIVEAADATPEQLAIQEINAGIYLMRTNFMLRELDALCTGTAQNAQGEFYLTDLIAAASGQGGVLGWVIDEVEETQGVNTRQDLAHATEFARARIVDRWMLAGVTCMAPGQVFIGPEVKLGQDVTLYPGVHLEGRTLVGEGSVIEPGCVVRDAEIGAHCMIKASCYLQEARLEEHVTIGPFAHLRPGADLGPYSKVGNFVEIKKTRLEEGAKASHLSYLGDAHVGARANIGAGTITCNYDGVNKHRTEIGEGAFIGSNTSLVAPIKIGDGAFVAAGSTLTNEVPSRSLGVARGRQRVIEGWADRKNRP